MMTLDMQLLRSLIACVGGLLIAQAPSPRVAPAPGSPSGQAVPYCEIVKQVAKFDHHVVETEVVYRRGAEISSVYSLSCPEASKEAWVDESEDLRKATPTAVMEAVEGSLRRDGRVRIRAVLEFDGPKPVVIPPGTPPWIEALMLGVNSRYGHANQFTYRVLLIKVIAAGPVPPDAPWPR